MFNYIPHRTPIFKSYSRWITNYQRDLLNLYSILRDIINNRYPDNEINWDHDLFCTFCRMVYNSSSKHI